MASLTETLGSESAQQGNVSQGINQGLQTGMQLATVQDQVQQKHIQTQQMQDQLDSGRYNTALNSLYTLARTNPAIAKRMVPKIAENFQKAGMSVDENVLHAMASDDSFKQRMLSSYNALSGQATNPAAVQEGLMSLSDVGEFDKGLDTVSTFAKNKAQQDLLDKKSQAQLDLQDKKNQGMLGAATIRANSAATGIREENSARSEFTRISNDKDLKPLLDTHQQGAKDLSLINDAINSGQGVPVQTIHEMSSGLANMIQNGGSAVSDRDKQEMYNLGTKIADMENKARLSGVSTVNDPELFSQMKDQFSRLMDATKKNATTKVNSLKRDIKNPYLAGQQDKAVQNIQDMFKQNEQTAQGSAAQPQQASGGGQAPAAGSQASPKFDVQAFTRDAQSKGATPQQIQSYLQAKGIKVQ